MWLLRDRKQDRIALLILIRRKSTLKLQGSTKGNRLCKFIVCVSLDLPVAFGFIIYFVCGIKPSPQSDCFNYRVEEGKAYNSLKTFKGNRSIEKED